MIYEMTKELPYEEVFTGSKTSSEVDQSQSFVNNDEEPSDEQEQKQQASIQSSEDEV